MNNIVVSRSTGSELPAWIIDASRSNRSISAPGIVYEISKRVTDLTLTLLCSPLILLLCAICYTLVKLDSPNDSAFFKQTRTGKNGKRFTMYKFRTMVSNSEELKQKYAHLNERVWPDFKVTNDPRITRIGKILRKTSLDELPQLLNVLTGEMSLVGPRPTSFPASTYSPWQTVRLEVAPGLTGIWQVLGRGEMDFEERTRLDYEYITRRSYTLDWLILLSTFRTMVNGK